jgi:hypothetical protein
MSAKLNANCGSSFANSSVMVRVEKDCVPGGSGRWRVEEGRKMESGRRVEDGDEAVYFSL